MEFKEELGPWKAPGKEELFKIPIFASLLKACNLIPLKRKNRQGAIKSINELGRYCKRENYSILIAPEGTRRRKPSVDDCEDNFLPFKKGPFHQACDNNFAIMIILMIGNRRIWPPG